MIDRNTQEEPQATERPPRRGDPSLSDQAKKVLRDVRELGSMAAGKVGRAVGDVEERGQDAMARGRTRAKRAKGDFERLVGDHPLRTLLIALGVGVLLGVTLRRKRARRETGDAIE